MKRALRQRLLVAFAATLVAAAFGLLAGYWIGRTIALRLTAGRLVYEAARSISESDTYAGDIHGALDAMYVTGYAFCSEKDMELLSQLLYNSQFLKEIGRIRDNKVACSTAHWHSRTSNIELPKPDSIGTDGVMVYRNIPLFRLSNIEVVVLRAGDSYVVMYPYFEGLRKHSAFHIKTTAVSESERNQRLSLSGVAAQPSWPQLTGNSDFRIGEILYSTRCSSLYIDFICTTAYYSVAETLQANRGELKAMLALGGLAGALFGVVLSIFYQRTRGMEQQLRRAISKDKLQLAYQPIVSLASGRIAGAEALARWTDEDGFAVGPDIFIKIAEERGFVGEITKLVVRHALRDFGETLRSRPGFHISINVAVEDLSDPEFLPMLERELYRTGVRAESLAIEITESSTARFEVAVETIRQLHRLGHSVHIDDFGTGYSSLAYLQDLLVDAIKIDRSFTRAIGTEAVTVTILPQILAMAEALYLQVIVEGIETSLQADYFSALTQPIFGQGWLYGHPVPVEELLHRLQTEDQKAAPVAMAAD